MNEGDVMPLCYDGYRRRLRAKLYTGRTARVDDKGGKKIKDADLGNLWLEFLDLECVAPRPGKDVVLDQVDRMIKEKKTPQYNSMPPRKLSSAEIQAIVEWQKKDSSGGGHAPRAVQGRGRAEQGETEDKGRAGQDRSAQDVAAQAQDRARQEDWTARGTERDVGEDADMNGGDAPEQVDGGGDSDSEKELRQCGACGSVLSHTEYLDILAALGGRERRLRGKTSLWRQIGIVKQDVMKIAAKLVGPCQGLRESSERKSRDDGTSVAEPNPEVTQAAKEQAEDDDLIPPNPDEVEEEPVSGNLEEDLDFVRKRVSGSTVYVDPLCIAEFSPAICG